VRYFGRAVSQYPPRIVKLAGIVSRAGGTTVALAIALASVL
jgi:hypothetical protein